ncbi:MAG: hypothetical protein Q6363_004350 [Candidatus Njordarchaeota archaeon]
MKISDEIILLKEIKESYFTLSKVGVGALIGTVFGVMGLSGSLYLLIAIVILFAYITIMWQTQDFLKKMHPLKVYLLYGTLSSIVTIMLCWTIAYNLLYPIHPPST